MALPELEPEKDWLVCRLLPLLKLLLTGLLAGLLPFWGLAALAVREKIDLLGFRTLGIK